MTDKSPRVSAATPAPAEDVCPICETPALGDVMKHARALVRAYVDEDIDTSDETVTDIVMSLRFAIEQVDASSRVSAATPAPEDVETLDKFVNGALLHDRASYERVREAVRRLLSAERPAPTWQPQIVKYEEVETGLIKVWIRDPSGEMRFVLVRATPEKV